MINIYKIVLYLSIPLFLFSCKKKEIPELPESNDPIFKVEGTIDGQNIDLFAGEENAYMYTYTQKINGVNLFTGKLSDGSTEIEFGVFDGNLDLSPNSPIEDIFNSIQWAIDPTHPIAELNKNSFINANNISSIDWYSDNIFLGTNYVTIDKPGRYNICALVTFIDGSQSQLCNDIILGYEIHSNFTLHQNLFPNGDLNAWIEVESGTISDIEWTIDNEEFNEEESNITTNINEESHQVTAKVTFTNGVVRTKSFLVDGSLGGNNIQDFSLFEITTENKQTVKRDFDALLVVKKNNIEYRSDFIGNSSGVINASKIDYYGLNSDGKKVYKITASINCQLKNMNSGAIVPMIFDASFGIEIP